MVLKTGTTPRSSFAEQQSEPATTELSSVVLTPRGTPERAAVERMVVPAVQLRKVEAEAAEGAAPEAEAGGAPPPQPAVCFDGGAFVDDARERVLELLASVSAGAQKCYLGGGDAAEAEAVEAGPGRCYLLFSESNGGSFWLQWSREEVEGALASFTPEEEVPAHKYATNGGRSELCREAGGPNVKKFYRGWLSFIKTASEYGAPLRFLANVEKQPVAIYTNSAAMRVGSIGVGWEMGFGDLIGVAVVGKLASGFGVTTLQKDMFQQLGEKVGAAMIINSARVSRASAADAPKSDGSRAAYGTPLKSSAAKPQAAEHAYPVSPEAAAAPFTPPALDGARAQSGPAPASASAIERSEAAMRI